MPSVKDKLKKDEYKNWMKSTLGLEITNRALQEYVKEKFTLFMLRRDKPEKHFTQDEFDHIQPGICCIRSSLISQMCFCKTTSKWELKTQCRKCQSALQKIMALDTNTCTKPTKEDVSRWKNCDDTSKITLEWAIAKMFMPGGNESNNGPEDTDISTMVTIMLNCKLFSNCIRTDKKHTVRKARNQLFHSADNLLTKGNLEQYFKSMVDLLTDASNDPEVVITPIGDAIKKDIVKIQELGDLEMTILSCAALNNERKEIYQGFERCLSNSDSDKLKLLLKLAESVAEDLQYMTDHRDEIKNIELYKNDIERLQIQKSAIFDKLQNLPEEKQRIGVIKTEIENLFQEYRQLLQSQSDGFTELLDRINRSRN